MAILPPRPYPIAAAFYVRRFLGVTALIALGLLMSGGFLWWQLGEIRAIGQDERIWRDGVTADGVSVSGKETSHHFILNSYELDVHYSDADHRPHRGHAKFDLLFGSVENHSGVTVRYDRADPSRFAVSWAVDHGGTRWAAILFMLCAGVCMGGLSIWGGFAATREIGLVRAVAQRSEELTLQLVSMTPVHNNGKHVANQICYRRADEPGKTRTIRLSTSESPLYTSTQRNAIVGLVSPHQPDQVFVAKRSLYPFAFSDAELAAIDARANV